MRNPELANKIMELRHRRAWSQSHLAEVSGLSVRTVQRLEKEGNCSKETLLSIAAAFDVDVQILTALVTVDDESTASAEYSERAILTLNAIGAEPETNSGLLFSFHNWFSNRKREWQQLMAAAGGILLIPPVSFFLIGILKYTLGFDAMTNPYEIFSPTEGVTNIWNVASPILFLGSLILALGLNLLPFLDLEITNRKGSFMGRLRYDGSGWNWTIVLIGLAVLFGTVGYVAVENIAEHAIRVFVN